MQNRIINSESIEMAISFCLSKWNNNDDRIDYFREHCRSWINQMPVNMQPVVLNLLYEFDYYSRSVVNKSFVILHKKLICIDGVDFDNTIYSIIKKQNGTMNSSQEYFPEYRRLNNISKNVMIPDLNVFEAQQLDCITNIVFIDDFCGTGKTMTDYLYTLLPKIKGKRIIYLVVQIMDNALEYLHRWGEKNQIEISVLFIDCRKKAFDRGYSWCKEKSVFMEGFKKFGLKDEENEILGFQKTEALTAFYNNTPNNTLGVFWKSKANPIFPRNNDKKPIWMKLRSNKKNRIKSNYLRQSLRD